VLFSPALLNVTCQNLKNRSTLAFTRLIVTRIKGLDDLVARLLKALIRRQPEYLDGSNDGREYEHQQDCVLDGSRAFFTAQKLDSSFQNGHGRANLICRKDFPRFLRTAHGTTARGHNQV
jgi:hypothetical protein